MGLVGSVDKMDRCDWSPNPRERERERKPIVFDRDRLKRGSPIRKEKAQSWVIPAKNRSRKIPRAGFYPAGKL